MIRINFEIKFNKYLGEQVEIVHTFRGKKIVCRPEQVGKYSDQTSIAVVMSFHEQKRRMFRVLPRQIPQQCRYE